jgi:16S rRNA (cytosine967-C5)-methyltransferase
LLQENCKRLKITCVKTGLTENLLSDNKKFDRVLVDAPCTNSGVIRRRLDLRWRKTFEEKKQLTKIQLQLLEKAAKHTEPNGIIVYSTCSIDPEENELIVKRFLRKNEDWKLDKERMLHPVEDQTDGAYSARLIKKQPC